MQSYASLERNFTPKNWGMVPQNSSTLQGFMGHSRPATQHELPLWSCMNRANIILKSWCNCWNISHRSAVHILMGIVEEKKKNNNNRLHNLRAEENSFLWMHKLNLIIEKKKKKRLGAIKVYRWEKILLCKASLSWKENNAATTPPMKNLEKKKGSGSWRLTNQI